MKLGNGLDRVEVCNYHNLSNPLVLLRVHAGYRFSITWQHERRVSGKQGFTTPGTYPNRSGVPPSLDRQLINVASSSKAILSSWPALLSKVRANPSTNVTCSFLY